MNPIQNLGHALTVLARFEAREIDMHTDVSAWGAPSECHTDICRGEQFRFRDAKRQIEALTRRPFRIVMKQASLRGCHPDDRYFDRLVGRILHRISIHFQ